MEDRLPDEEAWTEPVKKAQTDQEVHAAGEWLSTEQETYEERVERLFPKRYWFPTQFFERRHSFAGLTRMGEAEEDETAESYDEGS
jgi:hypothetical protein